jgi:hypothetical protein
MAAVAPRCFCFMAIRCDVDLQRRRTNVAPRPYREPPEGVFLGCGTGQKCVSSPVTGDVESLPASERKTEEPPPAVETRRCDGCDADFQPPAHGRAFAALPAGCGLIAPFASDTGSEVAAAPLHPSMR